MREIKFRAWDCNKNKMYQPIHKAYKGELMELLIGFGGQLLEHNMRGITHESAFDNKFILMQFTGLKDKNGKEIFEDDICELDVDFCGSHNEDEHHHYLYTGTINFMPSVGYYLKVSKCWDVNNGDAVEIFTKRKDITQYRTTKIGNIHQNPELLWKKQ